METKRDSNNNVIRNPGFTQVCVMPGTLIFGNDKNDETALKDFIDWVQEELGARVQFLEEIITFPDHDENGNTVPDTGGRNDIFFAIHEEDIQKCAVKRLLLGIRWLEDVLAPGNYHSKIYPDRVRFYQTWPMDGTPVSPEETAPAVQQQEQQQTTNETKETEMEQKDTVTALIEALAQALMPQLSAKLEEVVEKKLNEKLKGMEQYIMSRAQEELVESDGLVKELSRRVLRDFDYNEAFNSSEFDEAVRDVVTNMDFQIEVSRR